MVRVRVQLATEPTAAGTLGLEKTHNKNHNKGTNIAASVFFHSRPLTVMGTSPAVS